MFHHSQAWAPPTKTRGHAPLLESHTGAEAGEMLQVIRLIMIMIMIVIMMMTRLGVDKVKPKGWFKYFF